MSRGYSPGFYVLIGKLAVPVKTVEEWAQRFEHDKKRVADTQVGKFWISTVFLGLDHNFGTGLPILFETMVFGPDNMLDLDCARVAESAKS